MGHYGLHDVQKHEIHKALFQGKVSDEMLLLQVAEAKFVLEVRSNYENRGVLVLKEIHRFHEDSEVDTPHRNKRLMWL